MCGTLINIYTYIHIATDNINAHQATDNINANDVIIGIDPVVVVGAKLN